MVQARHPRIQLRRADVAPAPSRQSIPEFGPVGRRKQIQRRLKPVRCGLPRGHRRHRLLPHVGPAQEHVLVRQKEKGMVAANRSAQRRGHILQSQGSASGAGGVGEPVVGGQQFMPEPVHNRSVNVIRARTAGQRNRGPGQPAHLRTLIGGLHAKFVHRLQRQ